MVEVVEEEFEFEVVEGPIDRRGFAVLVVVGEAELVV